MKDETGSDHDGRTDLPPARPPRYVISFSGKKAITLQNDEGATLVLVKSKTDKSRRIMASLVEVAGMLLTEEKELEIAKIQAGSSSLSSMMSSLGAVFAGGKPPRLDEVVGSELASPMSLTGLPKACPDCGAGMPAGNQKCVVCEMLEEKEAGDAQEGPQSEPADG